MFELIEQVMTEASKAYDVKEMKLDAYMENVMYEIDINAAEAELKVMKESGTDEDFAYLLEEAQDGFVNKVGKVIAAIVENLKKFFAALKDKVIELFTKKEVEVNIDQIEKKVKFNPVLRAKKVSYEDTDAEIKVLEEHEGKIKKFIARLRGGDSVSMDEFDDEQAAHASKMKKVAVGAGAAALTTVGIVAAIALLRKKCKTVGPDVKKDETDSVETIQAVESNLEKLGVESISVMHAAIREAASTAKQKSTARVNGVRNIFTAIKEKLSKGAVSPAEEDTEDKSTNESVDDLQDVETGDSYFNALEAELFGESTEVDDVTPDEEDEIDPVTESEDIDPTDSEVNAFLEELEADLFGEDEEAVIESGADDDELQKALDELSSL